MPVIQINMIEGRSTEQKRMLARKVCEAVVETLGVRPEQVRVLIHQMTKEEFSVGGVTFGERDAAASANASPASVAPAGMRAGGAS